jgi:hypothetical protein
MYFLEQGRKKFHQEKFKTSIQTMAVGVCWNFIPSFATNFVPQQSIEM